MKYESDDVGNEDDTDGNENNDYDLDDMKEVRVLMMMLIISHLRGSSVVVAAAPGGVIPATAHLREEGSLGTEILGPVTI